MRTLIQRTALLILTVGCAESGPAPAPAAAAIRASDLLIWRTLLVRGETTPVLDSSTVYFLEQEVHVVSAVDRQSGALKWRRVVPTSRPDHDGYGLALAAGVLVVGDLDVFGLNPSTGAIIWKFNPTEGSYPGFGSLSVEGSTVFCGSTTGHVYAVDAATGAQLWVTSLLPQYTQVHQPKVVDGVIYAGFTQFVEGRSTLRGGAVALEASTGKLLWRTYAPDPVPDVSTEINAGVAVTPSLVVLGSNHAVYGLDRKTGEIEITVGPSVFGDLAPNDHIPIYTGSLVIVGTGYPGLLTALDPVDLHKVWRTAGEGSINALTFDESRTYIARIFSFEVFRTSDGVRLWKLIGEDIGAKNELYLAAPALDSKHIYLPGTKGVYAFKKE